MSTYGITTDGFKIKRFGQLKKQIEELIRESVGNVDQSSSSLIGNLNAIVAQVASELWEANEQVYTNFYPNGAEGIALDNAVLFNGILRLKPSATSVEIILVGTEGTLVEAGSQFETNDTEKIFQSQIDQTITEDIVLKVVITTASIDDTTDYTITIDSIDYTYTSDASATQDEIIQGLITSLNSLSNFDKINTDNETITIISTDRVTKFSCSLSANLLYDEIGTPIDVIGLEKGSIAVPTGTLTEIVTPIFGLDSVINLSEGITGRDEETDNELRLRREISLQVLGACTLDAIFSRLSDELEDYSSLNVYHNPTDSIDAEGRNAHSVEVVIEGGNDTLIAQKIFEVVAAGIETVGNQSEIVFDSQGNSHIVKFTRPIPKYAHLRYNGTLGGTGTFPLDGTDQIKNNTIDIGETFKIGDDFILQKFYDAVYKVPGVFSVDIEIAITNGPLDPPSFQTNNLIIAFDEGLVFSLDRIETIGFTYGIGG